MIDWQRWGGEPPDRYQIAMLLVLSVAVVGLTALQVGLVDGPPLENASLRCPTEPRGDSVGPND